MSTLANSITQGQNVNLRSYEKLFHMFIAQGVKFTSPLVYARRQVSKRALEDIAHLYSVVQQYLEWLKLDDNDQSFLDLAAGNTRVHPTWGQMRAGTSRMYSRQPPVQNVSRKRRYLFIPAPGNVHVKADYCQAQLRILAHLSEDENLVALFNSGRDPHGDTAAWLGIDRDTAKQVNFGICYGMSAGSLAVEINQVRKTPVDEATAQSYIDAFCGRYPGVRQFFDTAWRELKGQRKAERITIAPSGRIRKFNARATKAVECQFRITWPQQIEADLIKTAMVRLDRILRRRAMKAQIIMMIHDALWVECPESEAEQVRHLVRKMMSTAAKMKVPLEVDIE